MNELRETSERNPHDPTFSTLMNGSLGKVELSVLSWNINDISDQSLGNKSETEEFRAKIGQVPIFCLQETKNEVNVPNYRCFNKNRETSRSGGLCIGVHRSIAEHFTPIKTDSPDIQALMISKSYTKWENDVFLINIYDSQEYSSYKMKMKKLGHDEQTLESLMNLIGENITSSDIMLVGDFNARTGSLNYIPLWNDWTDPKVMNAPKPSRASKDQVLNERGRKLIDLISCCNLTLLNGSVLGDIFGEYTCLKYNGQSIPDYMAVTANLRTKVKSFKILPLTDISDHKPLLCTFSTETSISSPDLIENIYCDAPKKPKWDEEALSKTFSDNLNRPDLLANLIDISATVPETGEHIYAMNEKFVSTLASAIGKDNVDNAPPLKPRTFSKKKRRSKFRRKQKWFDAECIQAKRELNKISKKYGKNPCDDLLRVCYYSTKKTYRKMIKRKKSAFLEELSSKILQEDRISWDDLKSVKRFNEAPSKLDIFDMSTFHHFFAKLYSERETNFVKNRMTKQPTEEISEILNGAVSEGEIIKAVKSLRNGKAVGLDQVLNEQLKCASQNPSALRALTKLFNGCLDLGVYPWNTTIVSPLHKKGCIYNPDNYRAIAIGSNLGKLFATILLNRLLKFREAHCPDTKNQLGFSKNARTVDHLFTLSTCIEKHVHHNGKRLYTCFVDFQKAFDSISREALLYKLSTLGIEGKFFKCLEFMYKNSNARIKLISKISDTFDVLAGTEQGHPMSPELFKTYIHELSERLNGLEDIECPKLNETILTHLLWADDLVLVALTKDSLQLMLRELESFCAEWGLSVNIKKTAIMIFNRSGRLLKESFGFKYENREVPTTRTYCYLGITFSLTGNFKVAMSLLRQKALRAYFGLKREVDFYNIPKTAVLKLLDSLILPVITYGIELWISKTTGFKEIASLLNRDNHVHLSKLAADPIERFHLSILKWTLGVNKGTSNAAIWGDCGRTPLVIRYVKQVTVFFNRLCRLDREESPALVRHAFAEQKNLNLDWFNVLSTTLNSLDENRHEQQFVNATLCQNRAKDRFISVWQSERQHNRKLRFYNEIKDTFELEPYLALTTKGGSTCVGKIRMSAHKLKIETGRYRNRSENSADRLCDFCCDIATMELMVHLPDVDPIVEDETHFLRTCPRYHTSRTNLQDPVKSLLMYDIKAMFAPEVIQETARYIKELLRTRFPRMT